MPSRRFSVAPTSSEGSVPDVVMHLLQSVSDDSKGAPYVLTVTERCAAHDLADGSSVYRTTDRITATTTK